MDSSYSFDLSKVPQQYRIGGRRLSKKPKLMTFYKGGLEAFLTQKGELISLALRNSIEGRVDEVKRIIESGDTGEIDRVINEHTSHYHNTALLSATPDFEKAVFEAKRCKGHYQGLFSNPFPVVFKLRVHPSRFIYDAKNIGKCGYKREVMLLGKIFEQEIIKSIRVYGEI